jgi:8-oxo-dGTP pyrophosphatase MutT (NUDIX family)
VSLPLWLRRLPFRVGYPVVRTWWALVPRRRRGVKCVIARGADILLVRHTYGPTRRWELPGGALKHGEDPAAGARREVREELGLDLTELEPLGELSERRGGALHGFLARVGGDVALDLHDAEIGEARWWPLAQPPRRMDRYARRLVVRVGAVLGQAAVAPSPTGQDTPVPPRPQ